MDNLSQEAQVIDGAPVNDAGVSPAPEASAAPAAPIEPAIPQVGETPPAAAPAAPEDDKPFYSAVPEDWRKQLAGSLGVEGDDLEKLEGQLGRYKDLPSLVKAGIEAQAKIRKGETSNGLPENPTDEQLAAYREANGIPEAPDKYELSLQEGLVLSDEDERILSGVKEAAHAANLPADTMSQLTSAMLEGRQREAEARTAQDGLNSQEAERVLRDNWGQDFEANKNALSAAMTRLPESVRDLFKNSRLQDGRAVLHSPEMINFLVDMERQINPMASVVPNDANAAQAVNSEIATLEKRMGTPEWFKDDAAQKRYQDLVRARDTAAARG